MEYTIKPETKFHKVLKSIQSKAEDIFLSVILNLARITKSEELSAWLNRYTEKKMQQLQQEIIRMKWNQVTLDKAISSIRNQDTQ